MNSEIRKAITVIKYRKKKITSIILATLVQDRDTFFFFWFWWATAWNSTRICFRIASGVYGCSSVLSATESEGSFTVSVRGIIHVYVETCFIKDQFPLKNS